MKQLCASNLDDFPPFRSSLTLVGTETEARVYAEAGPTFDEVFELSSL